MEILPLIGWVQMEILGSDWLVPNGNTGPKVKQVDLKIHRRVQLDLQGGSIKFENIQGVLINFEN